ncbi:HlyD family efflux transporter periplasmic adaptor subunit [Chitinophaga lutea]|uniref:HlyD family efflux transporter periplasmic adaptor subunit n=1 Tax=Chitinophaga lutea TaxID=2488634 RepID=A0A3N4PP19_9BACT|nr:HlyD family efflux transporter periplasmic adaptor subunit [Chitinophaga lutea]RPE08409.1 HlyD family efflux transporter periplasmic adaptor subunit [Chitinophaga lutea]
MPQLFPVEVIEQSAFTWLPRVRVRTQVIYTTVLVAVLLSLIALPFIKVDVSVKSAGIVRPVTEKNELRSFVAGTIAEVTATEGQHVEKGQLIMRLQEDISNSKLMQTSFELRQREAYVSDLARLASGGGGGGLQSALYQQQYSRFVSTLNEQQATMRKLESDLEMYKKLFADKVIAEKELRDKQYEYDKAKASYSLAVQQQRSAWAEELSRYRLESNRLQADADQLEKQKEWNLIKAPVSGTLQQFSGRYAGSYIQVGEMIGIISPDSNLVAECLVSPKDIGYLRAGMPVKFQVDAFNYNEWGTVDGVVQSVDNDFTLVENQPVFKVKCRFDATELHTAGGVKGTLKKGMTLQARFILTKRSLFQLLYDKTDDWMNPNTAGKK